MKLTMYPLLIAITLILFTTTSTAQGYSPWSIDTIHGFEGRYIVTQSSIKQLGRSSVNKVRCIETYYNACDQITKRTSTTSKGSFAPQPVKVKEKVWRTDCTFQLKGSSIEQIQNDLLNFTMIGNSLLFTSNFTDTLSIRIVNLFGAQFSDGRLPPSSGMLEPLRLFFPWSGTFVIEIYHQSKVVYRNLIAKDLVENKKRRRRNVVRFRTSEITTSPDSPKPN